MRSGGTSTPSASVTLDKMYQQQSNATLANGIGQGVAAASGMANSIISYTTQMYVMKSQERMQEKAWKASIADIQAESNLLDDVQAINAEKCKLGTNLARTQKNKAIADARYLEAQKTQKSMKAANKAVLKKVLKERRSHFYGKTA